MLHEFVRLHKFHGLDLVQALRWVAPSVHSEKALARTFCKLLGGLPFLCILRKDCELPISIHWWGSVVMVFADMVSCKLISFFDEFHMVSKELNLW